MRGRMLAAHWCYLLFSMSPCQRRPPKISRSGSDPVKIVFDEFFSFHLIFLFRFLVFVAPGSAGSEIISTDFFEVLNGLLGVF